MNSGIYNNATINIVFKPFDKSLIQIVVCFRDNRYSISIHSTESIFNLKSKIREQTDILAHAKNLISKGYILNDQFDLFFQISNIK